MTLYLVKSELHPHQLIIAAESRVDAVVWFERITGVVLGTTVEELTEFDDNDAFNNVEEWWSNYCYRAQDNPNISNDEYHNVLNKYNKTWELINDVVYGTN